MNDASLEEHSSMDWVSAGEKKRKDKCVRYCILVDFIFPVSFLKRKVSKENREMDECKEK